MSGDGPDAQCTRLIAVRHGETAWNVDTRVQGQLDIGLNEVGRRQSARLAQALADERLDALYASDLGRARDTALAVAAVTFASTYLPASSALAASPRRTPRSIVSEPGRRGATSLA